MLKPSEIPDHARRIRRLSSTDWENPYTTERRASFADVYNDDKKFRAKIHLNQFESFDKTEIDVRLHNYDVQIHAEKENPDDPNRPLRILNRQYRLPDDVDLKTVRMQRSAKTDDVDVQAAKVPAGHGLPIGLNITDVTEAGRAVTRVQAF